MALLGSLPFWFGLEEMICRLNVEEGQDPMWGGAAGDVPDDEGTPPSHSSFGLWCFSVVGTFTVL